MVTVMTKKVPAGESLFVHRFLLFLVRVEAVVECRRRRIPEVSCFVGSCESVVLRVTTASKNGPSVSVRTYKVPKHKMKSSNQRVLQRGKTLQFLAKRVIGVWVTVSGVLQIL